MVVVVVVVSLLLLLLVVVTCCCYLLLLLVISTCCRRGLFCCAPFCAPREAKLWDWASHPAIPPMVAYRRLQAERGKMVPPCNQTCKMKHVICVPKQKQDHMNETCYTSDIILH